VSQHSWKAGLTGAENATRAGREGEKKTGAESEEERSGHYEIGLGEYETHRASNDAVHEEEDQRVEKNSHLIRFTVHELDVLTGSSHEDTGAESEKQSSRDGDLLGGNIGEHLIYTHIIFRKF